MASTKTRRTGKEGLHTRVKQGKKAVKNRDALDEQMRHFEDNLVEEQIDNRVQQYRLVSSGPHPEKTLRQKIEGFASDTGFDSPEYILELLSAYDLRIVHHDSCVESPVVDADELADILTNMARVCGWRLTYKLEKL